MCDRMSLFAVSSSPPLFLSMALLDYLTQYMCGSSLAIPRKHIYLSIPSASVYSKLCQSKRNMHHVRIDCLE